MIFSVDLVEAVWVLLNVSTLFLTVGAFFDARANQEAVKLLNGHARELAAEGIVRREAFRLIVQGLLLALVLPGLWNDVDTPLSYPVIILMSLPVILLLSSVLDARDRKRMTLLVAKDVLGNKEDTLTRIESKIDAIHSSLT